MVAGKDKNRQKLFTQATTTFFNNDDFLLAAGLSLLFSDDDFSCFRANRSNPRSNGIRKARKQESNRTPLPDL